MSSTAYLNGCVCVINKHCKKVLDGEPKVSSDHISFIPAVMYELIMSLRVISFFVLLSKRIIVLMTIGASKH